MAKKERRTDREVNYKIERINVPMSRDELDKLCDELKSDDDFINFCLDEAEQVHNKYMITIMNDETKSPIKNDTLDRSYGFMQPIYAVEFLNEYIDEGKANSKPKEVMRTGYNKRSKDKYIELVNQELEETMIVNQYTQPSFEDVMSNIYVNVYNGETYHQKDDELPDDLRENVGVIIPGLIENTEEYFEFVKRLKDKGKGGLGRSIYERYEDYLDAKEIIETYKQALYDKYGGKEEFFTAKELGGIFGAYEYFPMIKPRFKKNQRNMKLDRGINLNELASVKDMGERIRQELEDEINEIDVENYEVVEYEETPGKYRDLPEDLALLYKNDVDGNNGFDEFNKFKSIYQYAKELIGNKDNEKDIEEGYRILSMLESENIALMPAYKSEFVDIIEDISDIKVVIDQYGYDKLAYYEGTEAADTHHDVTASFKAYKNLVKDQICTSGNIDPDDMFWKTQVEDAAEHAAKYMFNPRFREAEDAKKEMNAAGDVLYRNNRTIGFGDKDKEEKAREGTRANESKVQAFIRDVASSASNALDRLNSNADTSGYDNVSSVRDITGYNSTLDVGMVGFEMQPNPDSVMSFMIDNELFAKKVYEIGADASDDGMFSMRTGSREFVNRSIESSKPFVTENVINNMLKANKKRRGVE